MNTVRNLAVALAVLFAADAGATQSPTQRDAQELARFQRHASPPQQSMHYFRLDNFQYLGKNEQGEPALAVWTGVNRVYLLTLQSPCLHLDLPLAISLTSTSGNVNARMDYVKYGHGQQCKIETIQKVDYKAMRAEKAQAEDNRSTEG
jgi:hypothetical protein